jgi:DNA-binding CsgD family transcriptional regulator
LVIQALIRHSGFGIRVYDANMSLRLRDVRSAFRLLGEVREIGADPNIWRPHMVLGLRKLVGAEVVVSSEVHFRKTREANVVRVVDIGWGCDEAGQPWRIYTEQDEKPESYWLRLSQSPSTTNQDEDVVAVKPTKPIYGGHSFVLSQCELPHIAAVDQLGLHRAWGNQSFTASEHRLVRMFHLELARLWRADALKKTRDPASDLPPRLAQTLHELANGLSEKQVALKLDLSPHTIHNYIKALHQRFEVNSRAELLAKVARSPAFQPKLSI